MTMIHLLLELKGLFGRASARRQSAFNSGDAYVVAETIRLNRLQKRRRGLP